MRNPFRLVLSVLSAVLVSAAPALAQDGTLLSRDTVRLTDDFRTRLAGPFARMEVDAEAVFRDVVVERIAYRSDGLRVHGYLVAPREGDGLPAVIFNRGGNRDFGALDDTTAVFVMGPLAQRGYVLAASQYRGSAGGEGQEEFGGADVNDVLNLIPLIEGLPRADPSRIGMYGWSRGGLMTYLALTRTDRIRAAVIGGGAADAFRNVEQRPEMEQFVYSQLVPNWATDREAALEARSPVRWPDRLHKGTPILMLHGSADWRVDPIEALDMARALYEARHPFRFMFFEGGDHGLSEYRAEVHRATLEWLDRYVRDRAPLPDLEPHGR